MKQNIMLNLDKGLIRKARVIAAKRSTSISKMISDELARAVEEAERFSALSGALNIGLKLPAGTRPNLMQSLKTMSEKPGADKRHVRSMAQAALIDPHRDVRAQARDVLVTLEQLDTAQTLTRTVSNWRELLQE